MNRTYEIPVLWGKILKAIVPLKGIQVLENYRNGVMIRANGSKFIIKIERYDSL